MISWIRVQLARAQTECDASACKFSGECCLRFLLYSATVVPAIATEMIMSAAIGEVMEF